MAKYRHRHFEPVERDAAKNLEHADECLRKADSWASTADKLLRTADRLADRSLAKSRKSLEIFEHRGTTTSGIALAHEAMALAQAAKSFVRRSKEYATNAGTQGEVAAGFLRSARLQLGMIPGAIGVAGGEIERSIPAWNGHGDC